MIFLGGIILISYVYIFATSIKELINAFKKDVPSKSQTISPCSPQEGVQDPVVSLVDASSNCHPNSAELTFLFPQASQSPHSYRSANFLFVDNAREFKSVKVDNEIKDFHKRKN